MKSTLPDAPKILLRNVYGWFVRVERGLYTLSEGGKAALTRWKAQLSPSMVEATPESPALLGES